MPISTRTVERWTCDRCGNKQEFPHPVNGLPPEDHGWYCIDLQCSLHDLTPQKNEQVLCPICLLSLNNWFKVLDATCPGCGTGVDTSHQPDCVVWQKMRGQF